MDFGKQLKEARESKDLTLQQVSRELKINLNVLKKIEASDANALPNPTSTKGFLRSYAQHLDLDANPVIEDYTSKLEVKRTPVEDSVLKDAIDPTPFFLSEFIQKKVLPVIFLFVVLCLGFISYQYLSGADQILNNGLIFQAKEADITKSPKPESTKEVDVAVDSDKKFDEEVEPQVQENNEEDFESTLDEESESVSKEAKLVIEPLANTYAYYKDQSSKTSITLSLKPNVRKTLKFKEAEITFLDAGAVSLILNGKDIGSPGVFAERKTIKFPSLEGL
jgi:cytoskeletal protein RodZ